MAAIAAPTVAAARSASRAVTTAAAAAKGKSLAIIGAGIGGLSLARALRHHQCSQEQQPLFERISVYEKASHFSPSAGAGFGLSPNGQICFSSIGLDGYRDFCHNFDNMVRLDCRGSEETIQVQSDLFKQVRNKFHGFGIGGCLRSDVIDLLAEPLLRGDDQNFTLSYSHKLQGITIEHDKVKLYFENGKEDVVDMVVGADGINSTVATLMGIDPSPPTYSGANIFYGKIEGPDELDWHHDVFAHDHTVVQMEGPDSKNGAGECLTFRAGKGAAKVQVWAATYNCDSPPAADDWDIAKSKDELERIFLLELPAGHPLNELADKTSCANLLHFGLFFRPHKNMWFDDDHRVVLLGDSCHATLPYVGQGANQAAEDAIVLSQCLLKYRYDDSDSGGFERAFKEYYKVRFPRTKKIVQISSMMHTLYHTEFWWMRPIRNFILNKIASGGMIMKQMESEIVNHCPVKNFEELARPGD